MRRISCTGLLLLMTTFTFEYIHDFGNDSGTFNTCLGFCGLNRLPACSCDVYCFVYKSCCADVIEMCPDIHAESQRLFSAGLLNATPDCIDKVENYIIKGCGNKSSNASADDVISEHVSLPSLVKFPVIDNNTGVLFEDLKSYKCFASEGSKPVPLEMIVLLWSEPDMNYPSFIQAVRHSDFFFKLPDSYKSVKRKCLRAKLNPSRPFKILVQLETASSTRLELRNLSPMGRFVHVECDAANQNDSCAHVTCGSSGYLKNGKCLFDTFVTLTFTHPLGYALTISDLTAFAEYNFCSAAQWMRRVDETEIIQMTPQETNYSEFDSIGLEFPAPYFTTRLRLSSTFKETVDFSSVAHQVSDEALYYLQLSSSHECSKKGQNSSEHFKGCVIISDERPSGEGMCKGLYVNQSTGYPFNDRCFNETRNVAGLFSGAGEFLGLFPARESWTMVSMMAVVLVTCHHFE